LALVIEGGSQSWSYIPNRALTDGEVFDYSAETGVGQRSRYAGTTELRLPLAQILSVSASGRYDDYIVSGSNVDKATYNVGFELRPLNQLLLRGRYGTAFKAPTLADEFQGRSTFSTTSTDYYQCALAGFTGTKIGNCPYAFSSYFGATSGNPNLKPITANVWDTGAVWTPLEHLSMSADYLHWAIDNEVTIQSADQLLKTEALCRLGTYDLSSPTCVAALAQVTRDSHGMISSVFLPKINVSHEAVNALTFNLNYKLAAGQIGTFAFEASWSDMLKHTYQQYAGDPTIDELRDATFSTDFKSKVNVSVTWSIGRWANTLYANVNGRSPNFLASLYGYGTAGAASLPSWTLFNFTSRYQCTPALGFALAIDNAFNRMPPVDHSYPGTTNQPYNAYNYNVYGRSYYLQASYKFL